VNAVAQSQRFAPEDDVSTTGNGPAPSVRDGSAVTANVASAADELA